MRRIFGTILVSFIIVSSVRAQAVQSKPNDVLLKVQSNAPLPSVDQVLQRYVEALGGETAIKKVFSRVSKGTVLYPDRARCVSIEIYEKAPNKVLETLTSSCTGTLVLFQEGFDGSVGWDLDNVFSPGVKKLYKYEIEQKKQDAEFYYNLKLKELYPTMTLTGIEQMLGEREAYVIEAKDERRKWYFDTKTGLLLSKTYPFFEGLGEGIDEMDFDDYRMVDDIMLPLTIIHWGGPEMPQRVIRLTEVRHNVPIDDGKFTMPTKFERVSPTWKRMIKHPPK